MQFALPVLAMRTHPDRLHPRCDVHADLAIRLHGDQSVAFHLKSSTGHLGILVNFEWAFLD